MMVILPLVVAAVAVAIITAEKNAGTTKARLNDSTNAQITAEYFGPDVQGAQFLTTKNAAGTATTPSVCGAGTGTTLVLGLYRPATSGVSPMSVGYWVTSGSQAPALVRYACTIGTDGSGNLTSNPPGRSGTTLISDDISATQQAPATITPAQFATATSAGWAPISASTTVATPTSMTIPTSGTWTLQVASTSAFDVSQPIVLATATSSLSINCTGPTIPGSTVAGPGTSFTGCSNTAGAATTVPGLTVSQPAAVSAVTLSVFQPGSSDAYTLAATPRSYTPSGQPASGPGLGAPALLTLGGGDTINATTNQVKLTVNGTVAINSGTLTCTGPLAIVTAVRRLRRFERPQCILALHLRHRWPHHDPAEFPGSLRGPASGLWSVPGQIKAEGCHWGRGGVLRDPATTPLRFNCNDSTAGCLRA